MGLLLVWVALGWIAALIGKSRGGGSVEWFVIGCILGPFAILWALTLGKRCPHCLSKIHEDAKVCPKCQRDQPRQTF